MREAIGGSYIFQIVIVFIALFSAFLVYSISYTKAFRVKNEIISLIEEYQGFSRSTSGSVEALSDEDLLSDGSVEALAYRMIKNVGYNKEVLSMNNNQCYIAGESSNTTNEEDLVGEMFSGGYCLYKVCTNSDKYKNTTYKITSFIAFKIPVLNATIRIPISGETRTIYSDNGQYDCSVRR